MTTRAAVRRWLVLLLGVLTPLLLTISPLQSTSASWVDVAVASAAASSGSWSASPGTCSVEKLPGYTGAWNDPSCTVTALKADVPWGTTGSRLTNVNVTLSFAGSVAGGQEANFRVVLSLNLATATNLPPSWNWSSTGVGVGNLLGRAAGYQCSSLAQAGAPFGAYVHGNYFKSGQSINVYFPLYENHGTLTGLVCP